MSITVVGIKSLGGTIMEKKTVEKFGTHFLLGKNFDGEYVYLKKASWDCDWYWGFGYLRIYTNNTEPTRSKDIAAHFHFDGEFLNGPRHAHDMFINYFAETVLTDSEVWQLCDYMKSFYTLKAAAEVFGRGYSHYTESAKLETLKYPEMVETINHVMLPALFEKIEKLLTE
jgi:hypothetical protein